jgi:hypothetical protein
MTCTSTCDDWGAGAQVALDDVYFAGKSSCDRNDYIAQLAKAYNLRVLGNLKPSTWPRLHLQSQLSVDAIRLALDHDATVQRRISHPRGPTSQHQMLYAPRSAQVPVGACHCGGGGACACADRCFCVERRASHH